MKKDPKIFLSHIEECVKEIEKYIKGMDKQKFLIDLKTQDAVIRRIEIIGEAVKNLPASFKKKHKEISWREIAGMRDVLIHEYFGVDTKVVWKTAKKDIPELKNKMRNLLENL